MDNQDQEMDMKACATFIQNKLLDKGVVVKLEDIEDILDIETEWMVETGIAQPID